MKNTLFIYIFLLFFVACKQETKEINKAQEHMHSSSFTELVERFEDPTRAEWQQVDKVLAFMKLENDDVVGDIGAGTGYFSFPMAKVCKKVIAIDIDQQFVDYINHKKTEIGVNNLEVRLSKPEAPNFEELECDKIIIVNTVHHLDKVAKYLSKARDCLRLGGSLIIVDFKEGDLPVEPPAGLKLELKQLKRELGLAGFSKLEIDETTLPYQYMIKAY